MIIRPVIQRHTSLDDSVLLICTLSRKTPVVRCQHFQVQRECQRPDENRKSLMSDSAAIATASRESEPKADKFCEVWCTYAGDWVPARCSVEPVRTASRVRASRNVVKCKHEEGCVDLDKDELESAGILSHRVAAEHIRWG